MPKVTVLMPVYNGESFLREAIDSILAQTYSDFEFLIVDDGSTDGSNSIIQSYYDKRITVLKNADRLKLSGALNRGIDEAQGKYIARMDADDIALPDRLAKQVAYLDAHPDVGICGAWVRRFGKGFSRPDKNPVQSELIRAYALFECPFSHPTIVFRKDLFDKHNLRYNGDYYPTEDYELWSRAVDCFPCANIDEVLLRYRVHAGSMTGSDWDEMDTKGAKIARSCLEKLGLNCAEEEVRLHRNIGRAASCRCTNLNALDAADKWLDNLYAANQKKQIYDTPALQEVISLVWFRLCFNSTPLGASVIRRYRASRWFRLGKDQVKRSSLIILSVLKNSVIRPQSN